MNIAAIVVLYNPKIEYVLNNIHVLSEKCNQVILVDNSSFASLEGLLNGIPSIHYIPNLTNLGIAAAQNVGLQSLNKDIDYVFFFDQDSSIDEMLITNMLISFKQLSSTHDRIGSLSPLAINCRSDKPYALYIERQDHQYLEVREVLSSGTMIPLEVIKKVGVMDDTLFIDGVDSEWAWRAKKLGYHIWVDSSILMKHMLGEGDHVYGPFSFAIPSFRRTYFQYRNFIWLCKRNYVPFLWKLKNFVKYTVKFFYYPVFCRNGFQYLKSMIKGIKDGFFS